MNENFNLGCYVNNVTGFRYYRTESDKKQALKLLNKHKSEETFTGMCARCLSVGALAKKNINNHHYGCTNYCCPLLHQWNVCEDCLKSTRSHFHPVKYPDRQVESLRFQRVFSRLPEDVQRYISEFTPNIFDYVRHCGRLFRAGQLFYNINTHAKFVNSIWKDHLYKVCQSHCSFSGPRKNASGANICKYVKNSYRTIYREYYMKEEVQVVRTYGLFMSGEFYNNSKRIFLTHVKDLLTPTSK